MVSDSPIAIEQSYSSPIATRFFSRFRHNILPPPFKNAYHSTIFELVSKIVELKILIKTQNSNYFVKIRPPMAYWTFYYDVKIFHYRNFSA